MFWEVDPLPDTRTQTVIRNLKSQFAHYGIASQIMGHSLCHRNSGLSGLSGNLTIGHLYLHIPRAMGKLNLWSMAKRILTRSRKAGTDPYIAILNHPNTPPQSLDKSPVPSTEFNGSTNTLLPMRGNLLQLESHWIFSRTESRAGSLL